MSGPLAKLLDDDPVAAYWVGFIAADGCFTDRGANRLQVGLGAKDQHHLIGLADWLGRGKVRLVRSGTVAQYAVMDAMSAPVVRERFDFKAQKTTHPPAWLPYRDSALLRCWLVGFIDGDGHLRRQTGRPTCQLSTVSHLSWLPFMEDLSKTLQFGKIVLRRGGSFSSEAHYVSLASSRHHEVVALKEHAVLAGLPLLARKWDRVDVTVKADRCLNMRRVAELIEAGWKTGRIAQEVGCSEASVSNKRARMRREVA